MKKWILILAAFGTLSLSAGCVRNAVTPGAPQLTATQQVVAGAALAEQAVGAALVTAKDTAATLVQGGVISAADANVVDGWLVAVAHQNDSAIALTKAGASAADVTRAVLAVAEAIGAHPALADVKNPGAQASVSAMFTALVSVANSILQEFK